MSGTIKINFLNANGGGYAEEKEVPAGITVGEFVAAHVGDLSRLKNFALFLNGQAITAQSRTRALATGDSVTVTPIAVKAA